MEVEIDIDDELLATAREYTGINDVQTLAERALQELVDLGRRRAKWKGFDVPPTAEST